MRRLLAAAVLASVLGPAAARAGDAPPSDAENPRNVRFVGPVVETVRATPRIEVAAGERSAWPAGTDVRFEASVRVLPGASPSAGTLPTPRPPASSSTGGRASRCAPRRARSSPGARRTGGTGSA